MSAILTVDLKKQTASPWWEILVVMAVSLGISLVDSRLKGLGILIPLAYLLIERFLRKRSWTGMGFNIKTTPGELLRNLGWVLLVGVGTQALAIFGGKYLLPEFFDHVIARLPIEISTLNVGIFVALLLGTLSEEIIYRALFQKRLTDFLPVWAAIGLSSVVFGLMHFAAGPALIVFVDIALVVLDSIIYGIIYARSNNVFVSWIAHFMADVVAIILLLMIIK